MAAAKVNSMRNIMFRGDLVDVEIEGHRPRHDQLPDIEEYKVDHQSHHNNSSNVAALFRKRKFVIAVAAALVFTIAMIGIGVSIGSRGSSDTSSSTNSDNNYNNIDEQVTIDIDPARLAKIDNIIDFVTTRGWSDEASARKRLSPQWSAAAWMADEEIESGTSISDSVYFKQRYALATFYFSLNGPEWRYSDINNNGNALKWLDAQDVCDWGAIFPGKVQPEVRVGVDCDCRPGIPCDRNTVKRIYMPDFYLSGTLPNELGLLTDLEVLDLHKNRITGSIPYSVENLVNLRDLVLSNNSLIGGLPNWLGKLPNLQNLNLGSNNMDGTVPAFIAKMESLKVLNLRLNNLKGNIKEFQGLYNLEALFLDGNRIEGQITDELVASWPKLVVLDLSDNWLDGNLPSSLLAVSTLTILDIHGNQFSGEFPDLTVENESLYFLAIHNNTFTGPIKSDFRKLINLKHLDVSDNQFTGDIPEEFSSLFHLEYLFLGPNPQLNEAEIPMVLSNIGSLKGLSLKNTNRIGFIPPRFGSMDNLLLFDVEDNKLRGMIPNEFGLATKLRFLLLNSNQLEGDIPSSFANLRNIDVMLLDHNNLYGSAEPICAIYQGFSNFVTDCGKAPNGAAKVDCKCCTVCCHDDQAQCYQIERVGTPDPIWEQDEVKSRYDLDEEDIIYPNNINE